MSTEKTLFSKARAILRKNVEFISNLNVNVDLFKNIGGEKSTNMEVIIIEI